LVIVIYFSLKVLPYPLTAWDLHRSHAF